VPAMLPVTLFLAAAWRFHVTPADRWLRKMAAQVFP